MRQTEPTYVPAAGYDWALPFYDPLLKLLRFDARRIEMLERADIRPRQRVLDIGCGTGTLAVALKQRHPQVEVIGIDPDRKALAIARRKAGRAQVMVRFDEGRADELPYGDGSYDHILSSFMFHHLAPHEKRAALREARRVLEPGGELHVLDFHDEHDQKSWLMRLLHASNAAHELKGQLEHGLDRMMEEAGLCNARVERRVRLPLGAVAYYCASAPS